MTKRYLNVSYQDRDLAKRLGAQWDASVKRWYCPKGSALEKIFTWRAAQVSEMRAAGIARRSGQPLNFELPLAG